MFDRPLHDEIKVWRGLGGIKMIRVSRRCSWPHGTIQHATIVVYDRRETNVIVSQ
jgi:hypothetical protein